jgi:hypothetical protein
VLLGLSIKVIVPFGVEQLQEPRGYFAFRDIFGAMERFNIFEATKTISDANLPPASISRTRKFGFSERRDARTHPAVPG